MGNNLREHFGGDSRLSSSVHSGTHPLIVTGLILSHYYVKVLFSVSTLLHCTGPFQIYTLWGCLCERSVFRWIKILI